MYVLCLLSSLSDRYVNKSPNRTEVRPVGKCFVHKVDDENLTFIIGVQPKVGREVEFVDFVLLSVYNFSTRAVGKTLYCTEI